MDRISGSLCSVLHHIFSFPCAQIDLAAFGGADVGRCLWRRLRPVSLLPEPFLSPCWKLLLPALAPGWGVGWQDSLGRAKAVEGWDGRGSSSTGAPCWGEASSSHELWCHADGELSPHVEPAGPLSWARSPRWRMAQGFLSSPAEMQSEMGFKGTEVFWMDRTVS